MIWQIVIWQVLQNRESLLTTFVLTTSECLAWSLVIKCDWISEGTIYKQFWLLLLFIHIWACWSNFLSLSSIFCLNRVSLPGTDALHEMLPVYKLVLVFWHICGFIALICLWVSDLLQSLVVRWKIVSYMRLLIRKEGFFNYNMKFTHDAWLIFHISPRSRSSISAAKFIVSNSTL